jgi:hypothetical protein
VPKQTKPRSFTAFDTPEESARVFAIVTEADPFRPGIRGHALEFSMLGSTRLSATGTGRPAQALPAHLASGLDDQLVGYLA